MHRFLNLLLSIITLSLHGKHHLQQIKITRDEIDSINGFNCTNIIGAQVNSNGTCACTSATTILSDENGRLKCENLVEDTFPSKFINFSCQLMKGTSAFYQTIEYIGRLSISSFHRNIAKAFITVAC